MLRAIFTFFFSILLTQLIGEDTIILQTGELLPCEILWEKPDKYKVSIQASSFVETYGQKAIIEKTDVHAIRDHVGHRRMKGFGKVFITPLDMSRKIKGGLYATTPNSIVLISSQYKRDGKRIVNTKSILIAKIENIRWHKSQVIPVAVAGGLIGLSGGIYAGNELYQLNDSESKSSYVITAVTLTAAGTGLGALLGYALSPRIKLDIHGDLEVWAQHRHRLSRDHALQIQL